MTYCERKNIEADWDTPVCKWGFCICIAEEVTVPPEITLCYECDFFKWEDLPDDGR